jgi:hypothetical protein
MSSDSDPRIAKIARGLLWRTRHGSVSWEYVNSPRGGESFWHSTEYASIVLRSADGDGQGPYEISVRDGSGAVLERVVTDPFDNSDLGEVLEQLYTAARRKSLNIDETLDRLVDYFDEPPF